ncbi:MAG: branched-chain-amino-acid transaminase [candidate division KSB1 bacterium]
MIAYLPTAVAAEENNGAINLPLRKLLTPDFDKLAFEAYKTKYMYLACHVTSEDPDERAHWPEPCFKIGYEIYYGDTYEDRNWRSVAANPVVPLRNLALHPATCALHYGPAVFEGTKAFLSAKNRVVLFRPQANAQRFEKSAGRTLMPKVPQDMFLDAVTKTVLANREFIPPFRAADWAWETRNAACLYVRPLLFGHGPMLGVRPSKDHLFLVYCSPVRTFYPASGMRVLVTRSFHRAAPGGLGNAKASANYVAGLLPTQLARRGYDWINGKPVRVSEEPFNDVLYLDAVHNKYVEEFSGATFLAITTDGTLISPQSESILAGITRDSVVQLAQAMGVKVEQRPLSVEEVMNPKQIASAFCTGNAAVVTPVVTIHHNGETRTFDLEKMKTVRQLWDLLVGIQLQMREDTFGWVEEIG